MKQWPNVAQFYKISIYLHKYHVILFRQIPRTRFEIVSIFPVKWTQKLTEKSTFSIFLNVIIFWTLFLPEINIKSTYFELQQMLREDKGLPYAGTSPLPD